ncbi:MAG: Asp23/Gls24 family envelope stress response protein [Oscillospiraceae bacterium]|jgi:uncharacterized alkaline shock family protein YloU|nr:Asp23/Gls24 family envelope stress response protein [Oscillospiraceae bacterium]
MKKQNGSLQISKYVIMKIAELAAAETNGVALFRKNRLARIIKPRGNTPKLAGNGLRSLSPVKVTLNGEALTIDVYIIVKRGANAYNIATAVQENIKSGLQDSIGLPVSKVNVRIVGVTSGDTADNG